MSVIKVKNIKTTLDKVETLNQQIKEKLQELKKNEKSDKLSKSENVQAIVDELRKKRDRILRRLYRRVYRLKKAFPAINTKEIVEVLNKKIDIRKKGD